MLGFDHFKLRISNFNLCCLKIHTTVFMMVSTEISDETPTVLSQSFMMRRSKEKKKQKNLRHAYVQYLAIAARTFGFWIILIVLNHGYFRSNIEPLKKVCFS